MRKRKIDDHELDALGGEPAAGEVWWCRGETLGLPDGAKVRPVLVLDVVSGFARVIPLTTRKPDRHPVAVAHNGGLSWLTNIEARPPRTDLISSLGHWYGFGWWVQTSRSQLW